MYAPQTAAGFGFLRIWTSLGLHVALLTLIVQRRDLSNLDHFVFLYLLLLLNLSLEALHLLAIVVMFFVRGAPQLAAEDVALTARLVEQGRRLAFSPFLQAATVVPDTLNSLRIQRRRWVRGYTQVVVQQICRLPRLPLRAQLAALAMAIKTVSWPLDFALSLVYGVHAWIQGQPAVLLLAILAMLFPFSLSGSSRFVRSDRRTLLLFTFGYGMLLLGWRIWDQLTLLITPHPRWEPYRRRQASGSR
ncbi:MAG: hypothetical protein FJ083_14025 [Cyanobacteria bacterium K_Offshore_surface_m2_239]|nr:hypothetical protein [Cyanobacteria bacterium K_Offshore_surface_m2_239]